MKLRPTTTNDLNSIVSMEMDVANAAFILPYSIERHTRVIKDPNEEHLSIFDEHSRLIGFILLAGLTNQDKIIEFKRIVVTEKNKGYGSRAIQHILQKCFLEYNCTRVWLDVFESNRRAIHVYEQLGFRKERSIQNYRQTETGNESLIIMSVERNNYQL